MIVRMTSRKAEKQKTKPKIGKSWTETGFGTGPRGGAYYFFVQGEKKSDLKKGDWHNTSKEVTMAKGEQLLEVVGKSAKTMKCARKFRGKNASQCLRPTLSCLLFLCLSRARQDSI